MYFYSISNVCGTKQQNHTKWHEKVSIPTAWFTHFYSFSSASCVCTKRQKFFIWFILYLDREFNEVLKAPKKKLFTVIFRYMENIFLKQNLIVTKMISDWRDACKTCLCQVLNETVLYSRRTLNFNFWTFSYLALFIKTMKNRF
jgi:hypothetical protein